MKYEWCNNVSSYPCWRPRWYMMTNQNQDNDNAHQAWHQFKTQVVITYYKFLWSKYLVISCWALSNKWHHSFENIHDGKKFLIMNLVVNLDRKKLRIIEVDKMKKIVFSMLWESMAPSAKLETSVSKTKDLERFAWIKNGVVVNEIFKDWKVFSASIP
jgi:hypothetical protein